MEEGRVLTENEQKKEFLNSYQKAQNAIVRLEEQLTELRLNKLSPSSMIGDGMPHAVSLSDLSTYASKVDELERDIMTARYKRIIAFQKVQRSIEAVENETEKNLLTYRYIRGFKWEIICTEMRHSWQHVHRIHTRALKNFKACD